MPVITISRQLGSLGTEIARAVAEGLHYECADKEMIWKMMVAYGIEMPEVERFDEKNPPPWDFVSIQRRTFLNFLRKAVCDLAGRGNVVIVGRGGQVLLKGVPGTLHVRIFAPPNVRLRRLMEGEGVSEKYAGQIIWQSDHDSAGYIRSFFNVDWEDPGLYHLLINTEELSVGTGVGLIIKALHSTEIQGGIEKAAEKIANLALVQKVEFKLLEVLGVEIRNVEIKAEKGVVFLNGTVTSTSDKENSGRAALGLEGVAEVKNQLSVIQYEHLSKLGCKD